MFGDEFPEKNFIQMTRENLIQPISFEQNEQKIDQS